ncbi:uncharacterized protein LOC120365294 [Saimiri boliviensis]|uniref:uncharacterized protein LOC120365294 n=1 Tax=Saimiri boliviensis TaxID=27679 RepID=UPI003D776610
MSTTGHKHCHINCSIPSAWNLVGSQQRRTAKMSAGKNAELKNQSPDYRPGERLGAGCLSPRRDPTGSKLLGNGVSSSSPPLPDQGLQTHTRARPTGPAPPFPEPAPRTPRGPIPGEGLASSSFRACPTSAALLGRQGPRAETGEGHPPGRCHMLLPRPQRPLQVPAPAAVPGAVPSAGPAAPPAARPWPPDVREGSGSPRKFQRWSLTLSSPSWSAVAWSRLTTTFTSRVQMIFLRQPPQ